MDRSAAILEAGIVGALAAHNLTVNHLIPTPLDDAFNVVATAGLIAVVRRNGFTWDELGLEPSAIERGVRLGTAAAVLSMAAVAAASAVPQTRSLFHDDRATGVPRKTALYHTALRIPIATALCEEVLFRGVLTAALSRRRPVASVGAWSSVLFGLWHVLPTLRTARGNSAGQSRMTRAIGAAVLGTTVAGGYFFWLRQRSRSIVAPTIAHAAINASAYLLARSIVKKGAG